VKLTHAHSKIRVLRSGTINRPCLRHVKKRRVETDAYDDEWYFTRDSSSRAQRWGDNRWILLVGYYVHPERKASKSSQKKNARTIDARFNNCLDIPNYFPSESKALLHASKFRRHVESVVRGNRPRKTLNGKVLSFSPENTK